MRKTYSLSNALSVSMLTAMILILTCVVATIGVFSYKYVRDDAINKSVGELKTVVEQMNAMIVRNEYVLKGSTWLISENLGDPAFMSKVTHNIMVSNDMLEGCMLLINNECHFSFRTDDGVLRDTVASTGCLNEAAASWLRDVAETRTAQWGNPFFEKENDVEQLHIIYTIPVFDAEGTVVAVFSTKMNMKGMTDMLMAVRPYDNSYSGLVNGNTMFASFVDSPDIMHFSVDDLPEDLKNLIHTEEGTAENENKYSSVDFMGLDGSKKFAVIGPLANNWYAITVSQYADVFATLLKLNHTIIAISLILLLFLLIATHKIVKRFTQPITQFTFSALNVSKGNFGVSIPDNMRSTELIRLRGAMTNMLAAINNYIQELRTSISANERYESELNIAREIQQAMLPTNFPKQDSAVDIFAILTPAKEVGGDMYDFVLTKEKIYFTIGDVSGKGVPAALLMAITKEAFKFVSNLGLDVHEVISKINNTFCDGNLFNMFITLFAGSCNFKTGKMKFCNAGHNPIIVIPPDGKAFYLKAKPNLAAGLIPDFPYEKEEIQIEPGTRLLLYTDGVTEAEAADKSQFGEERLLSFASEQNPEISSEEFIKKLEDAVHAFTGSNPQNDDITILSIKFNNTSKS